MQEPNTWFEPKWLERIPMQPWKRHVQKQITTHIGTAICGDSFEDFSRPYTFSEIAQ